LVNSPPGSEISIESNLPASVPAGAPLALPTDLQNHLDAQERAILVRTLQETGFNRTAAAARLGLSLRQIRYRIARLSIDVPQGDEPHDEPAA
jgi:two-component system, NtrC family, response regulator PilR